MTNEQAIAEAAERGRNRGVDFASYAVSTAECPDWLSGEWAGESIPELLGDLMPEDEDEDDLYSAICDAYCSAADEAFFALTPR